MAILWCWLGAVLGPAARAGHGQPPVVCCLVRSGPPGTRTGTAGRLPVGCRCPVFRWPRRWPAANGNEPGTSAHVHVCAVEVDLAAQRRAYPASLLAYAAGTMISQALGQGFTTVRDAGGADWGMKEAVGRGLIPGPRMFVSGHPLSQSGGHGDSRTRAETYAGCGCGAETGMVPNIADGVDEVRRAVRTQLRRGADAIKVMAGGGVASPTDQLESSQYQPDELSAAVADAEAAGTYVLAHAYTPAAIRNAVQAGVRPIEHGNYLASGPRREPSNPKAGRPARRRRRSAGRHRRAAASGQPDGDRQGRPVPQTPDIGQSRP